MNFSEGQEGKEFLTEITAKAHRGHSEVTELFLCALCIPAAR